MTTRKKTKPAAAPDAVARVSWTGVRRGDTFPLDHPLVRQLPERFHIPGTDGAADQPAGTDGAGDKPTVTEE